MFTYDARVSASGKRFTLEMPRQLRPGDPVTTAGRGGGYRVAYVLDGKARRAPKIAILVPAAGVKKRGRPRKIQ